MWRSCLTMSYLPLTQPPPPPPTTPWQMSCLCSPARSAPTWLISPGRETSTYSSTTIAMRPLLSALNHQAGVWGTLASLYPSAKAAARDLQGIPQLQFMVKLPLSLSPKCKSIITPVPGLCRVTCAHCYTTFLFNTLNNTLARCPHCRKVSSVGPEFARTRSIIFLVFGLIALGITIGITGKIYNGL